MKNIKLKDFNIKNISVKILLKNTKNSRILSSNGWMDPAGNGGK